MMSQRDPEGEAIIVSLSGDGQFRSLTDAISHCRAGTTIKVKSGTYAGPISIDKDLEIVGVEPNVVILGKVPDRVEVGGAVMHGAVDFATIASHHAAVTFRYVSIHLSAYMFQSPNWTAIRVRGGAFNLDRCQLASDSAGCVCTEGAASLFRGSGISKAVNALIISDHSQAVVEDCIFDGRGTGIDVEPHTSLIVKRSTFQTQLSGIRVEGLGRAEITKCRFIGYQPSNESRRPIDAAVDANVTQSENELILSVAVT